MANKISTPIVSTITAELHVVKIGNKQMTISVYNQLYIEDCWDEDYNILYPVWGKINREEEFVIFQKGAELRKCKIPKQLRKLNFGDHLVVFIQKNIKYFDRPFYNEIIIKESKYSFNERRIDNIKKNISEYDINNKIKSLNDLISILDESFIRAHQEEFQKQNLKCEKREKMINNLINSRQIFIAI